MYLCDLLKDWPCLVTGQPFHIKVCGITEDDKQVQEGFIFVARRGKQKDGLTYIEDAIHSGAVAVVIDREWGGKLSVPIITVPNCQRFLSFASAQLAGNPAEHLQVIAITGTNGKTTVSHFIAQMLQAQGKKVALFGTLGVFINGCSIPFKGQPLTTLSAEYLHPLLARCVAEGVTHVVMEASSLGLSNNRLAHCRMEMGVLLNIGEDHYEEHGGMEAYHAAKKILLTEAQHVVVNGDDETCIQLIPKNKEYVTTFGKSSQAKIQWLEKDDGSYIDTKRAAAKVASNEMTAFNQINVLAAVSVLVELGFPLEDLVKVIGKLRLPPGRMESFQLGEVEVIVDYAHTPDALAAVLASLSREQYVLTVFGCGGNRDQKKRKQMGRIASSESDQVILTSDNPRHENPTAIITDILAGIAKDMNYTVEIDRKKAIEMAIAKAMTVEKAVVLIAGKGHENIQIIGDETHSFSDRKVVEQCFVQWQRKRPSAPS